MKAKQATKPQMKDILRKKQIDSIFAPLKIRKELKKFWITNKGIFILLSDFLPSFKFSEFTLHQLDFFGLGFKNILLQDNQLRIGEMCLFSH